MALSHRYRALSFAATAVVAVACAEGSPPEDAATTDPEDFQSAPLEGEIERTASMVRTRGFTDGDAVERAFLVEQGSLTADPFMRHGSCYVLVAMGTSAIGELDLRLFDSDGGEVAQASRNGPRAALEYCPPQSGTFYAAVTARIGNGLVALRSFVGPTGLAIRLDDLFGDPPPQGPLPGPSP